MASVAQWADGISESSEAESVPESDSSDPPSQPDEQIPAAASITVIGASSATTRFLDLPPELLGDILLLARHDDYSIATTFSHINTACREFALNTPMLWSSINITQYSLKRHKLHLSRSADSPLTVRWAPYYSADQLHWENDHRKEHAETVMTLLSPHCARIRSFNMSIWDGESLDDVVYGFLLDNDWSNLEVLQIGPSLILRDPPNALLGRFARLGWPVKDLRARGLLLPSTSGFWSAALNRLKLSGPVGISLPGLIRIVSKTPSLQQLTFEDLELDASAERCTSPAPLHNLTELSFVNTARSIVSDILAHISTPNLLSLGYTYHRVQPEDPIPSEHPLITAASSNPQLQRPDLTQCDLTAEEWARFLAFLPELTHLRSVGSELGEKHLATLRDHPASVCPKLVKITFDNELYLTTSFVRELVEARAHVSTPISTLR